MGNKIETNNRKPLSEVVRKYMLQDQRSNTTVCTNEKSTIRGKSHLTGLLNSRYMITHAEQLLVLMNQQNIKAVHNCDIYTSTFTGAQFMRDHGYLQNNEDYITKLQKIMTVKKPKNQAEITKSEQFLINASEINLSENVQTWRETDFQDMTLQEFLLLETGKLKKMRGETALPDNIEDVSVKEDKADNHINISLLNRTKTRQESPQLNIMSNRYKSNKTNGTINLQKTMKKSNTSKHLPLKSPESKISYSAYQSSKKTVPLDSRKKTVPLGLKTFKLNTTSSTTVLNPSKTQINLNTSRTRITNKVSSNTIRQGQTTIKTVNTKTSPRKSPQPQFKIDLRQLLKDEIKQSRLPKQVQPNGSCNTSGVESNLGSYLDKFDSTKKSYEHFVESTSKSPKVKPANIAKNWQKESY